MNNLYRFSLLLICFCISSATWASSAEVYFDQIKQDPQRLQLFLKQMPKGGDLHTHLGGAAYAENLIEYAQDENFCIEEDSFIVSIRANCLSRNKLHNIALRSDLRNQLINAWSVRDVILPAPTHFFATFDKFALLVEANYPEILAEIANRAAENQVFYLESLIMPDKYAAGFLGKKIKWNDNFKNMETQLVSLGINEQANASATQILVHKAAAEKRMQCGTKKAQPGCDVKIHFIYAVLRNQPPTEVFAQLLAAFKTASRIPANVVGINVTQAEDGFYASKDYKRHMEMIAFLKKRNPNVNITLHAGELTKKRTSPENLQSRIQDAINIAHAKRIGHGVSISEEHNADALLKQMAKNNILVEINLTSNKAVLGVEGKYHPLNLYLSYGVPVALATDNEGILRTDMTQEYVRAVTAHQLSYVQLKMIARNSITYSFLPGSSIWASSCAAMTLGADKPAKYCADFLENSEKAQMQWKLEKALRKFESSFLK
ncbi:MAG: adenosine deaminase family protein [Gammaproteobacteria bacterium]